MSVPADPGLSQSGPALSPGPTRLLQKSVTNLLEKLDLSTEDVTGNKGLLLVLLTEVLLLCGAAGMMASLYACGQLDKVDDLFSQMWDLASGEKKSAEIGHTTTKTIHIITATFVHILLVPQLYILVVNANEKLTLALQLMLALLLMVLTLITQTVQTVLTDNIEDKGSCEDRETCFHGYMAWMLFLNIVVFLTIIFIRVLFNMRLRNWIVGIRVVGPILEFIVSRRSKDFQSLILVIILMVTVLSGSIINTKQLYGNDLPEEIESRTWEILLDLGSALLCLTGFLVLVLIFFHNHTMYSHTRLVSKRRLEQELASLGERHKQVLTKDREISKTKYCPVSRSARPVSSPQQLGIH